MKVGVMFANVVFFGTPEGAEKLAKAAEDSGIESLWTVEHVVVPEGYESPYPYSPSGKMPGGETAPIPDPLAWIAFMAAHTTTVRLATGVLILPQRNPVILAKECATIDVLSAGRLILGVGIGWLEEEFDAIGVPFDERVGRTEEYIAVAARTVVGRRDVRRQVQLLHARPQLPEADPGRRDPDRRRRAHEGCGTTRRTTRRRFLPRAHGQRRRTLGRDAPRREGRRTRPGRRSKSPPADLRTSSSRSRWPTPACHGSSCRRRRSIRTTSVALSASCPTTSSQR